MTKTDRLLLKEVDKFLEDFEGAKVSGKWDFPCDLMKVKELIIDLEDRLCNGRQTKENREAFDKIIRAHYFLESYQAIGKYLKSEKRFKNLHPEWFKVRGDKINDYLFSHIDKFKFRKKFLHPLKLEDVCVKWLLALQMLGTATWKDIISFSGESRDGMCQELDYRESMVGAGWMEIVGEERYSGKRTRPIYSITDSGADVIQYCAEH